MEPLYDYIHQGRCSQMRTLRVLPAPAPQERRKFPPTAIMAQLLHLDPREKIQTKRRMNEILTNYTGQPFEKVERDTGRDYILDAEKDGEYGVIDWVASRTSERVPTGSG